MSWKKLTIDDLRKILSEDEVQKLDNLSKKSSISNMIDVQIELVSDTWRGAFLAKGYTYDIREHFIPPEYQYWVLVHARYTVWTRFPNSEDIALDKPRKDEYEKAMDLLKNPYIGTSDPDWPYSSRNPVNQEESESELDPEEPGLIDNKHSSIYVPWLRFPTVEFYKGYRTRF